MKVEDLHKMKIVPNGGLPGETGIVRSEDDCTMASIWWIPGQGFSDKKESLKAAALFRAAYKMQKELRHLVRLLEPLEKDGGLNVPGLATLNGARAAIALSENTNKTAE